MFHIFCRAPSPSSPRFVPAHAPVTLSDPLVVADLLYDYGRLAIGTLPSVTPTSPRFTGIFCSFTEGFFVFLKRFDFFHVMRRYGSNYLLNHIVS